MFTPEDREQLRDELICAARADAHIGGAALVGSSALGREDQWSDIDLALCVDADAERAAVIAEWTDMANAGTTRESSRSPFPATERASELLAPIP